MKRYEALFILHNPTKEEGIKETVDLITAEVNAEGGTVETVQKMDRKSFARTASKKATSGFYLNLIFAAPSQKASQICQRFAALEDVFRVMLTEASASAGAAPAAASAAGD